MKDIDFDELDKAVSSVLTEPSVTTTDVPAETDSTISTAMPDSRPSSITPAAPRTASPSLPSKRRGQFMDVVHPSSDMTSGGLMATRYQPVVQPLASQPSTLPTMTDDSTAFSTTTSVSEDTPTSASTSSDTAPTTTSHEWPDPLDVMSERENAATTPTPVEPLSATQDTTAVENQHETAPVVEDEPLLLATNPSSEAPTTVQTPFIDGTNVEKRPLGAFAADETDEPAETDALSEKIEPAPEAPSVPPELNSDVVAIEEQHDTPDIQDEVVEVTPSEPPVTSQPLVAQSIPQQYTPETNHAAETVTQPHPVFDTKDYHQPLVAADAKPKKGKVGIIVLILVIMLVLGAGLGFLAFQYGLF